MNATQLRAALGVTAYRLRRWIAAGLPNVRRASAYDFDPDTVRDWLLANGIATVQPPPAVAATRADVAAYFAVHERTVATWLAAGCPGQPGQYDLAAISAWRNDQAAPNSESTDAPRARLARARAAREELRLGIDRGELLPAEPALRMIGRTVHEAKARLDQLPDQLLAIVAESLPADQLGPIRQRLQEIIDQVYTVLGEIPMAEEFTGLPPNDPDDPPPQPAAPDDRPA